MIVRKKSTLKKTDEEYSSTFGVFAEETSHHFVVNLTDGKSPHIYISEHDEYFQHPNRQKIEYDLKIDHTSMRCVLTREKWNLIQDTVTFEFNQRLKRVGLKSSHFKKGFNIIPRLFGKELILLCWAIEEADPGEIPNAIRNWQGLKPEERWWLYTMTNAATGQAVKNKNRGWRKAVRFALTENPVEFLD